MRYFDKCEGFTVGYCSGCKNFEEDYMTIIPTFKCKVHGEVSMFPNSGNFVVENGIVKFGGKIIMNIVRLDKGRACISGHPDINARILLSAYLESIGDKLIPYKRSYYQWTTYKLEYYMMSKFIGKHMKRSKRLKVIGVSSDLKFMLSDGTMAEEVKC